MNTGAPLSGVPRAPEDQASRLRRLVEQSASCSEPPPVYVEPDSNIQTYRPSASVVRPAVRSAPVVAIASGKGGVGKTNLAVNLAIVLAQQGLRITLVDADLGMANADVLCGLMPGRRLDRAISSRDRLTDLAISAPGGFRLVPGSVGVAQLAELPSRARDLLVEGLADLDETSDLILVDTAAGAGVGVLSFLRAADLALIVTTPEPTAITDAYGLIKCLTHAGLSHGQTSASQARVGSGRSVGDLRLVVNQSMDSAEGEAVYRRIEAVCARFLAVELGFLGSMCVDRAVPEAVRARHPFTLGKPTSGVSLSVTRIAAQIVKSLELSANVPEVRPRGIRAALSSWLTGGVTDGRVRTSGALG